MPPSRIFRLGHHLEVIRPPARCHVLHVVDSYRAHRCALEEAAEQLLRQYQEQRFSYADASFVVMRALEVTDAAKITASSASPWAIAKTCTPWALRCWHIAADKSMTTLDGGTSSTSRVDCAINDACRPISKSRVSQLQYRSAMKRSIASAE